MNTKHTPGPWVIHDNGFGFRGDSDSADWPIGFVYNEPYENDAIIAEQRANARLIAAAPDLLAALENMLPMWESGIDEPWVVQARAAITKAKGE